MLELRVNPQGPKGDTDLESPQTGHKGYAFIGQELCGMPDPAQGTRSPPP